MYQGWANPAFRPPIGELLDENEQKTSGAADSVRLFMVPGMGHCGGGHGVSTFDLVAALDGWVTAARRRRGHASRVRDGKVDRTRPLCAYPSGELQGKRQHRRGGELLLQ